MVGACCFVLRGGAAGGKARVGRLSLTVSVSVSLFFCANGCGFAFRRWRVACMDTASLLSLSYALGLNLKYYITLGSIYLPLKCGANLISTQTQTQLLSSRLMLLFVVY